MACRFGWRLGRNLALLGRHRMPTLFLALRLPTKQPRLLALRLPSFGGAKLRLDATEPATNAIVRNNALRTDPSGVHGASQRDHRARSAAVNRSNWPHCATGCRWRAASTSK